MTAEPDTVRQHRPVLDLTQIEAYNDKRYMIVRDAFAYAAPVIDGRPRNWVVGGESAKRTGDESMTVELPPVSPPALSRYTRTRTEPRRHWPKRPCESCPAERK
jgi:hypothetical protein